MQTKADLHYSRGLLLKFWSILNLAIAAIRPMEHIFVLPFNVRHCSTHRYV